VRQDDSQKQDCRNSDFQQYMLGRGASGIADFPTGAEQIQGTWHPAGRL